MIVNINTELSFVAKVCFNRLFNYKFQTRITDLILILEYLYETKWEYRNPRMWNDIRFSSYLMDIQLDFNNGNDIDLDILCNDIIKTYDFSKKEKDMFIEGKLRDRIWSILKFVSNTRNNEYEIKFD